jgi:hypothetical protein
LEVDDYFDSSVSHPACLVFLHVCFQSIFPPLICYSYHLAVGHGHGYRKVEQW